MTSPAALPPAGGYARGAETEGLDEGGSACRGGWYGCDCAGERVVVKLWADKGAPLTTDYETSPRPPVSCECRGRERTMFITTLAHKRSTFFSKIAHNSVVEMHNSVI